MSKIPNGFEVIQLFEQFSPKHLALEGDKIGLQIGTLLKPVKNIMIALDILEDVIEEAITKNVDLIIAHHPPIFRPLKAIQTDTPAGRIIEKCIKHDIAIYAAHTNLDVAVGGVNDLLADALELKDVELLSPSYEDSQGNTLGLGRIGYIAEEMSLEQFADHVKKKLEVANLRIVGNLTDKVKKVAVLGGDGNKYISQAKFKGADVFVTGDMYYHVAQDAMMMGLNIVDPGHNVEKVMKKGVTKVLEKMFAEKKFEVFVFPSEPETDPFTFK
ncbi:Nif3-like dinuclear metal center hexameric protein [Ferdinandcohnia quinoae]|uniref:GTP cyclohydrolase 1 type 2 homolog n=1 Tax=Fredinandcohnia quinoae TaxID=2918902 RepID=A0AAW5E052_9BACI|nr:Nif3-like dinuclear metal center hexameric protein [Fredinandcohnia sp. SECRCQ15]MCH1624959.1 Nif3-like dinuclear metal center hexameric protein [Fredinandcohnia sp. SECRCQ15]